MIDWSIGLLQCYKCKDLEKKNLGQFLVVNWKWIFHVEKRNLKKLCLTLCTESLCSELSKGPCEKGLERLKLVKMLRDEAWWEDITPKCGIPGPSFVFHPLDFPSDELFFANSFPTPHLLLSYITTDSRAAGPISHGLEPCWETKHFIQFSEIHMNTNTHVHMYTS